MNPIDTQIFKQEFAKFRSTEEGRAMAAPYLKLVDQVSRETEEQIDFEKLGYLTRGFELAVIRYIFVS